MGIPTVNGAVLFHEGYTANPLVFAGCVGLRPAAPAARPASAEAGDLIIVIGGRTGRDGLRGATFSSMEMGAETGGIASASVQIGHPIHEKQTQEAILQARDAGLYRAITDCGAGGFSSAIGEMASGLGATVQLDRALLKYPGLQPWEIWLSEAQERMVLAVPADNWPTLKAICDGQDIPAFALGVFEASGRLTLKYAERVVGDLSIHFLHDGIPQRRLSADAAARPVSGVARASARHAGGDATADLPALLAHPNIRSKEDIVGPETRPFWRPIRPRGRACHSQTESARSTASAIRMRWPGRRLTKPSATQSRSGPIPTALRSWTTSAGATLICLIGWAASSPARRAVTTRPSPMARPLSRARTA